MEKLNTQAKFKYNEVYRVHGEMIQIAYEDYVDALIDYMDEKRENVVDEFNALKELVSYPEMSDLTAFANLHIEQMIKENEEFDREFKECQRQAEIEKKAENITEEQKREYRPLTITSRVMNATAKALGYVFEECKDINGKKDSAGFVMWRKQMNGVQKNSNKALFEHFLNELILKGDKEVLRQATYSDGIKIWSNI